MNNRCSRKDDAKRIIEVVVIGGDHYNTYGIVRSLGEKGVCSHVIILDVKHKHSFVLQSRYVKDGCVCKSHEDAKAYLETNFDASATNIIICCSDEAETFVLNHHKSLSAKFFLPVCDSPEETRRLMNKDVIIKLASEYGIRTPKTWTIIDRHIPGDIVFPCITKPLESIKGRKADIILCHSIEALHNVVLDTKRCSDFVVQEYINYEKEISILGVVLNDGEVILSGCIDKLRTCMIGTTSFGVMVDNKLLGDIRNKLVKMIRDCGYRGLFSAEFLLKDRVFYFLEVNFRNDGNTYAATSSGLNLPEILINSFDGKSCHNTYTLKYPTYFMLDIEDFMTRRKNGVPFRQWWADKRKADCFLVYNKADSKPFIKKRDMIIRDLIHRSINKIKRIWA